MPVNATHYFFTYSSYKLFFIIILLLSLKHFCLVLSLYFDMPFPFLFIFYMYLINVRAISLVLVKYFQLVLYSTCSLPHALHESSPWRGDKGGQGVHDPPLPHPVAIPIDVCKLLIASWINGIFTPLNGMLKIYSLE